MTKEELDRKISEIERGDAPADEKTNRINQLNQFFANQQKLDADEKTKLQQNAEARLKDDLRRSYMENPAATEAEFERDYPQLKSDYFRAEALNRDAQARRAQADSVRSAF